MSKKLPLSIALFFIAIGAFAQTIVSTTPENRNVILEEFTGIYCGFCPEGHAIAQQMKDDNPDDVFLVNIHSGGFAVPGPTDPDFRTQWGAAIDAQSNLAGYPAGTINRQNFPGQEQNNSGDTALGRNQWVAASADVLDEPSYVNLAVTANMDSPTNTMTILVEAFYTGDSPEASNFLNVAIMQNNTTGPQSGGNMGNNYNHNHRLIDLVTGQWGEEISTVSTGNFVSRTYEYNLISNLNGLPVDPNELEIVVYMTETNQYVVSGSGNTVTLNAITSVNDANLLGVDSIDNTCSTAVSPVVTISNSGTDALTSVDISYDVNGGASETFTWTGNLATFESATITLPEINYTLQPTNVVNVSIPNDDFNDNNTSATSFQTSVETVSTMKLNILTDTWAEELSWEFVDSNGTVIESQTYTGNDAGSAGGDDNTLFEYTINVPADCITFNVSDEFGDGATEGAGGYVQLLDANGVVVYGQNGAYGAGFSVNFNANGVLGLDDNNLTDVSIFPNPANTVLNISNADNATVEVYNILGQVMMTRANISVNETLDVANLATGTYLVKIDNGASITTKKFIIAR